MRTMSFELATRPSGLRGGAGPRRPPGPAPAPAPGPRVRGPPLANTIYEEGVCTTIYGCYSIADSEQLYSFVLSYLLSFDHVIESIAYPVWWASPGRPSPGRARWSSTGRRRDLEASPR